MSLYKLKQIRMKAWAFISVLLLLSLAFIAPHQLGVLLLKATYIVIAVTIGYYADRAVFPYARPHLFRNECYREIRGHVVKEELVEPAFKSYALVMIRRAIIVSAVIVGMALGL